jgi:hypothetical protein
MIHVRSSLWFVPVVCACRRRTVVHNDLIDNCVDYELFPSG